ncbi:EscU/YscU/HrcU family type III secretion system export apparatus switch protein [Helicobacter fennelliae]|uniref:ABC transporter, putative n=2 Tax=Helicobacter fennelliae TaxID=215 RepID=T1CRZ2_9HELI|nr:EscU/YscU/HrcU family type III secretion system export apparatus switch protein [Helicobacter fennelliae]GAD19539.1 ABC transporter, putative [Helicobacter fennelliae MRY12-0050]SQB98482.1 flagellar biosynthesis protein FlhB [Helicobacter fennelliae]STP07845.1 flagellar biosynthesis protein FlhB [Helicobacter fennelliae]STQ84270.1 flagellar biosynthesis protein FlhB [Helicobacter fennelliae]
MNQTKKAVALAYDPATNKAPEVIASGKGAIAQKIIQKAKDLDIPLFVNAQLVDMLINVEINDQIPVELYEAVVEVFVWLNRLEKNEQLSL